MSGFSNVGLATGFAGVASDGSPEGDLTGSFPNPLVVGIWDRPVDPRLPADGDTLIFNGGEWIPTPSPASTTIFQGVWDANTNTPDIANFPGLSDGYVWIVGVSGTTNVGGISTWDLGDYAVYSGGNWYHLSNSSFGWRLSGNAGTNPTVNYVGTTDSNEFSIRANAVEGLRIHVTGDVTAAQNLTVTHDITGSNSRLTGELAVEGGDITTNSAIFNLLIGATGRINMGNAAAANWFSGSALFPQGMSGSHTRLVDGASAFVAGTGILVSSASNGAVTFTMSNTGSAGTYGTAAAIPVFSTDAQGRVTSTADMSVQIAESQVTNLLTDLSSSYSSISGLSSSKADKTTTISAGTGLTGGGDLFTNRTISLGNTGSAGTYGSASSVPMFTTDAQGRVTSVSPTSIQITESQITNLLTDLTSSYNSVINLSSSLASEKANKTTAINAGLGLVGGGNLSADRTLAINDSVVATISGSTFTGAVKFSAGLSGSLQQVSLGVPYLLAGPNITINTSSIGQISITGSAGGGSGGSGQWNELSPAPRLNTTGSVAIAGAHGSTYAAQSAGTDVFFYVSGSIATGSLLPANSTSKAVFGGDTVVSGSLFAVQHDRQVASIGTAFSNAVSTYTDVTGLTLTTKDMGNVTGSYSATYSLGFRAEGNGSIAYSILNVDGSDKTETERRILVGGNGDYTTVSATTIVDTAPGKIIKVRVKAFTSINTVLSGALAIDGVRKANVR